jgi:hypothetical protein
VKCAGQAFKSLLIVDNPRMRISRCVCINRSFCDLKSEADGKGLDFEQLRVETGAAIQCGLCRPYLAKSLKTGQTVFTERIVETEPSSKTSY